MGAKGRKGGKSAPGGASTLRRLARWTCAVVAVALIALSFAGSWFTHHPREWRERQAAAWPQFVVRTLVFFGDRFGDFTDALGLSGHDCVYEFDDEPPVNRVFFAGAPVRTGPPAPADVQTVSRGEFAVGWSPSLRHPVWAAYHVYGPARFEDGRRPNFAKDRSVRSSPAAGAYYKSGYDRGHMVPNHAIVSRYGEEARKRTFLMSNIAPQTPALNRGVWRDVEHRIADMWADRYGEIWVVVGSVPFSDGEAETIPGSGVDVPAAYFQLVTAQTSEGVRALALVFPQRIRTGAYPAPYLVSVDEIERLTGFDFLPDLPEFVQNPLEAETPSRMWPVGFFNALRLVFGRLLGR